MVAASAGLGAAQQEVQGAPRPALWGGVVDLREGLRKSAAWAPRTKGSTLGFVLGGRREGLAFGTGVVWAPGSRAGLRVKAELSPPCAVKGKVPGGAPCAVTPARGPEHD